MKQLIAALVMISVMAPLVWSQSSRQWAPDTGARPAARTNAGTDSSAGIDDLALQIAEMEAIHNRLMEAAGRMTTIYSSLNEQLGHICGPDREWGSSPRESDGMDQLCQTSVHDTLEYMELHNRMQRESRRFQTLSDIMKTRHDTAKSAIQNVR